MMVQRPSRRQFLSTSLVAALACNSPRQSWAASNTPFSFILLGDLHYDKLDHHDYQWLDENHAGDLSQIKNYSRLTAETMPSMFEALKTHIAALRASNAPPAFIVQVGDLVEGLCGSEMLSTRQNREAVEFVEQADLGLPFLFTKGNHDVTGNGASEAFDKVLLPFMKAQANRLDSNTTNARANHSVAFNDTQFAFFDAYDKASLEWLESIASERTATHLFVVVHPPVVPYGARATWHLYSDEKSVAKREKLLEILGKQEAIVLGGHLHKFSALSREAGGGRFKQLAISSVVSTLDETPRDILHGIDDYTGDQVKLEPQHSPSTEVRRRAVYDVERKQVNSFEYANSAGYAVVTINAGRVEAAIHAGSRQDAFRNVTLSG